MVTRWWVCDMVGLLQRGDYTLHTTHYTEVHCHNRHKTQLHSTLQMHLVPWQAMRWTRKKAMQNSGFSTQCGAMRSAVCGGFGRSVSILATACPTCSKHADVSHCTALQKYTVHRDIVVNRLTYSMTYRCRARHGKPPQETVPSLVIYFNEVQY